MIINNFSNFTVLKNNFKNRVFSPAFPGQILKVRVVLPEFFLLKSGVPHKLPRRKATEKGFKMVH
jgi:hypothetical protein